MNPNRSTPATASRLAAILATAALLASAAIADPPPAPYEIDWHTVDGGGGHSSSFDGYEIEGTIGQPDAGTHTSISGYALDGGYWLRQVPNPCPQDFNADGQIDPDDLADFITCYFSEINMPGSCPMANFNNDALVDPDDLADFITVFFGPPC